MTEDGERQRPPGGGRRRPAGIERARRTSGVAPPGREGRTDPAPRPDIPPDLRPDLPRRVVRELERTARDPDAVARALTLAGDALDVDDPDAALPYLRWAEQEAPRSASVREALGVAMYRAEDWAGALRALRAYRRMTGRNDQNHLIADCLRGLGRPTQQVAEEIEAMDPARDGTDRVAEGRIVWAAALADSGDVGAGRAVIRQALEELPGAGLAVEQEARLLYVAGDLADRDGDRAAARERFQRVAAIDEDLFDVAERLARLSGR